MALKLHPNYGFVEGGNTGGQMDDPVTRSYSFWVYIDTWQGSTDSLVIYQVFENYVTVDNYNHTKVVRFDHLTWFTDGAWRTPDNSIDIGAWYHVVVTYDNSLATNDPVIYINGVSQSITEVLTPATPQAGENHDVDIGGASVSSRRLIGRVADVRVYGRILSQAEVNTIYRSRGGDGIVYGLLWRVPFKDGPDGMNLGDGQEIRDIGPFKDAAVNNNFSSGISQWAMDETVTRRRRVG